MTDVVWSRARRFVDATSSSEACVSTSSVGASMDPQKCARVRQSSVVAVARHACTELFSSLGLGHLACATHDKQSASTLVEQFCRLLQELSLSREAYVGEFLVSFPNALHSRSHLRVLTCLCLCVCLYGCVLILLCTHAHKTTHESILHTHPVCCGLFPVPLPSIPTRLT